MAAQAFLADSKNYILDRAQIEFLKNETFYGTELVAATFKLCLMNLYLHNIGDIYGKVPVTYLEITQKLKESQVQHMIKTPQHGLYKISVSSKSHVVSNSLELL